MGSNHLIIHWQPLMMHSTYQCFICPMKRQPDRHRDYVTRRIGAAPGVHPARRGFYCGRRGKHPQWRARPDERKRSSRFSCKMRHGGLRRISRSCRSYCAKTKAATRISDSVLAVLITVLVLDLRRELWPKPPNLRLERGFDRPVRRLNGDHARPGIGDTASLADALDLRTLLREFASAQG